MKLTIKFISNLLLCSILLLSACETNKYPRFGVVNITNINETSATVTIQLYDVTENNISSKGIYITQYGDATVNENYANYISDNSKSIKITVNLKDLDPNTTYYLKGSAENSNGKTYSKTTSFTTKSYTSVKSPCTPTTNTFYGSSFYSTYYYENDDDYKIVANGSNMDLRIIFKRRPEVGKYITTKSWASTFDMPKYGCYFTGVYANQSLYNENEGDTVYVNMDQDSNYLITFCDMEFGVDSYNFKFKTNGNLKAKK